MKSLSLMLALVAFGLACGKAPAAAAASAQDKEAAARAKSAVEKTRSQKSYSVTFEAIVRVPDSSPMKITGETVWVAPGVLFTQYTASGGEIVRLLRFGEKVWLYHMLAEDWLSPEESGKPGAGRGVQNPDEVLNAILKVADQAVAAGKEKVGDVLEMKLDGAALQKVMRQQAADGSMDWNKSAGTVRLVSGPSDGLMYRMQVNAEVASKDEHLKGKKIGYSADVNLKAYNKDFAFEFTEFDPKTQKTINLPWPPAFLAEAEKAPGLPDELKAEIQKRRK
jgi:outer membrane lipoprotein-sorting protein